MPLPLSDSDELTSRGQQFTVSDEGGMTCVVVAGFPLPDGCSVTRSDLLLRLNPGYPDVPPDMWWFDPPVYARDGRAIEATQVTESYLGRSWQRWSRHFTAGQWRPGTDSLASYLALIRREVARCTETVPA
ncbi:MAG: E2/UBC family protein [Burkholderiaceae bacterium]